MKKFISLSLISLAMLAHSENVIAGSINKPELSENPYEHYLSEEEFEMARIKVFNKLISQLSASGTLKEMDDFAKNVKRDKPALAYSLETGSPDELEAILQLFAEKFEDRWRNQIYETFFLNEYNSEIYPDVIKFYFRNVRLGKNYPVGVPIMQGFKFETDKPIKITKEMWKKLGEELESYCNSSDNYFECSPLKALVSKKTGEKYE